MSEFYHETKEAITILFDLINPSLITISLNPGYVIEFLSPKFSLSSLVLISLFMSLSQYSQRLLLYITWYWQQYCRLIQMGLPSIHSEGVILHAWFVSNPTVNQCIIDVYTFAVPV